MSFISNIIESADLNINNIKKLSRQTKNNVYTHFLFILQKIIRMSSEKFSLHEIHTRNTSNKLKNV